MTRRSDVRLIRIPVSVVGMVLTTISAVLFLVVFLADSFGLHANPYIGIVFFLILPAVFLVGLVLIPLGVWLEKRRRARGLAPSEMHWPRIDLNDPVHRRRAVMVFALTMANIVIVSLAAYRGVEYMDSVEFCGQVCHTVMKPEFVAYQDGPHSRVACVACHIGPGAASFARAKVSGTRQVIAVLFNTYTKPIPAPVHTLRPARDVCEQCHWPEKFHGDKITRIVEYADDAENTETVTTLRMHVGGGSERRGVATGIHWHMNVANEIEYIATDDKRQVIPWVRLRDREGNVREYVKPGTTEDELARGERRLMDCIDCHNRPSHRIAPSASRAVDASLAAGEIDKTMPFIKREAVEALEIEYPNEDAALAGIASALGEFYKGPEARLAPAQQGNIDRTVRAVQSIYSRNVFPDMRVTFGTYPDHSGHTDAPGCFRCHDGEHVTKDGQAISQDCETCHAFE